MAVQPALRDYAKLLLFVVRLVKGMVNVPAPRTDVLFVCPVTRVPERSAGPRLLAMSAVPVMTNVPVHGTAVPLVCRAIPEQVVSAGKPLPVTLPVPKMNNALQQRMVVRLV